ncbi:type II toxin-antitoxin system Phd/YefM family antitoxin [Leuconostoc suionicum]|uniref:type II toxin-antitoxin system Phd/YefM family antitoxin n=1 Tax=Leuconostoc suionicum TaxID=1511761 RepID=UPI00233F192F|nr:type II toxin-antitoxin system Phd/YefM family antitoxin [Leuconostoc suionicum]MDC2805103.1 type II toxin-antitoxin system Phd/YefM family antitoxin [Leuconostoc suionicum]MDC2822615.1 type II toxin-antitoxin system Phd/YefM family antitoxin [Leuconostoc suionicum]
MLAVTQTNLRTNINQLLENVSRNDDTLVVTRSRRENVVIISEAEYNSWQETNYLMKNEINRKTLSESLSSNNRGEGNVLTLEEWEKMNC